MSGLSPDRFSFYGFIPRKAGDQNRFFETLSNDVKTSIVFESPKRIKKTLKKAIVTGPKDSVAILMLKNADDHISAKKHKRE